MRIPTLAVVSCLLLPGCAGRGRLPPPPAILPAALAWNVRTDAQISGPLATDGSRVYLATRDGGIRALGAQDGTELWAVTGPEDGLIAWAQGHLVARAADGRAWALAPESGATLWDVDTGVRGSIVPSADEDRVLVAGEELALLRARNGRAIWKTTLSAPASTPAVVAGKRILVGQSDGSVACLDAQTGAVVWTHRTSRAIAAPPAFDGESRAYVGTTDRRVIALGMDKGKLKWRWKIGADVQNQPVALSGMLLAVTQEAVLYCLGAGNGHLRWRTSLPARPSSAPILVGTAIVIACHEDTLAIFDARTGKRIGDIRTPGAIRTAPLVVGDLLVVGLRTRALVAFRMGRAPEPETQAGSPPTEKLP
jgi:outer membrane protein assembly factor BamB